MSNGLEMIFGNQITWALIAYLLGFVMTLGGLPIYTWLERRGAALMQMRPGPNRRGPYGIIQAVADAVKLIAKEDIVPDGADKFLHALAPFIFITVALTTFAVVPWSGDFTLYGKSFRLQVVDADYGLLFILAISSLGVHGIALAGWSANNKYSLLGGLRSAAQLVSYELAMGLALVCVFLVFGSVKLHDIAAAQGGGVLSWGICRAPIAFLIFITASYAETNRTPFDIVEADSEIVAGYLTEYSSLRFGLFYMGEYVNMAVSSVVTTLLFFGGWQIPWAQRLLGPSAESQLFPWISAVAALFCLVLAWDTSRAKRRLFTKGNLVFAAILVLTALAALALTGAYFVFDVPHAWPGLFALCGVATQVTVLCIKMLFFFWLFVWVRWTVPRFRYDQLMHLGWKVFLPLGLANIGVTGLFVLLGWL